MPFSEGVIISRTLASLQSEQNSTSAVSLDHGWNCFVDHSVSISHFVPGNDCRQIAPPGGYHHCGLATLRPHGIWSCNGLRRQNNEVGYHLLPMQKMSVHGDSQSGSSGSAPNQEKEATSRETASGHTRKRWQIWAYALHTKRVLKGARLRGLKAG